MDTPLSELRSRWGIPELESAYAAVADDDVCRDDFERAGMPEPPRRLVCSDRRPTPGTGRVIDRSAPAGFPSHHGLS